jgi:glycosyltransferase involved in cell wall biosynthesis
MAIHYDGVSIILPVYCREYTASWIAAFHEAVTSVLSQKCILPMEIIIVDDGSVEPVGAHAALSTLLKDQRIRVLRLLRNNGLVFALNVGLNLAQYQLIGRIDSDDVWKPEKLQKQVSLMMCDPDLTIVGTGMRMIQNSKPGLIQDFIRPGTWEGILRFMAEVGCPFPHGSILARKDIFYILGGYSHDVLKVHCEDFALWSIWLRFFKAAMIEEALYEYHVSEKSISSAHAEQQRRASGAVHAEYLNLSYDKIPTTITGLSRKLGLSALQTGRACYTAWRFYSCILADSSLVDKLTVLLPDRQVIANVEVNNCLDDRFFYFSPTSCSVISHARCTHGLSKFTQVM